MRQFKDSKGRSWDIAINVASIKRVRGLMGLDLAGLFGDEFKPLAELLGDPCKFVDVLWVLVEPQAKAIAVSDEQFGESLGGESLMNAADAFCEELADFFPKPRAMSLRQMLNKAKETGEILEEKLKMVVEALSPRTLVEKLTTSSGDVQASSASLPGNLPSVS